MAIGKLLIWLGAALLVLGVILSYAPGLFGWFGRLPGDIRIESENGVVFIPIPSLIVVSLVASILPSLFFRR